MSDARETNSSEVDADPQRRFHAGLQEAAGGVLSAAVGLASDARGVDRQLADDVASVSDAASRLVEVTSALLSAAPVDSPTAASDTLRLASRIRHDAGNALNQVLGYCDMLLEDVEAADPLAGRLSHLRSTARQMQAAIDGYSRWARGQSPISAADRATRPATEESALHQTEQGDSSTAGRILVVDDNAANRDLLSRRLQKQRHQVATAEDGRDALGQLARAQFDLVLLDVMMPEIDGFEVLARLKADEQLRDIPVIMITALDEVDSAVRCIELGAEDYLTKPFDPVLLRARIGACLEKKRLRDREKLHLEQIDSQRRRNDELLHVILPTQIVEELKARNFVEPRRHESVAVMFADLVGFTPYCDSHPAEAVVDDLQRLIEAWEEIALRHQVQKIKTIGDSFMAAAGLVGDVASPVFCCVRAGLEMIDAVRKLTPQWQVRIGVHCGAVVAGVLGRRQYLYDLWGDTVNTAARMESHGVPGSITMSQAAWGQVAEHCEGQSLGTCDVKGKNQQEIIRLVRLRHGHSG